jgi:hypothetical protein
MRRQITSFELDSGFLQKIVYGEVAIDVLVNRCHVEKARPTDLTLLDEMGYPRNVQLLL